MKKTALKISIILGIFGFVLFTMFGLNGYIEQITIPSSTFIIYKFNFANYVQAIKYAFTDMGNLLNLPVNTTQFTPVDDITSFWNNFKAALELIFITPINILLWIIRMYAWLVKGALTILGWPAGTYPITLVGYHWDAIQLKFIYGTYETIYYESVLMRTLNWISQNLIIPYF